MSLLFNLKAQLLSSSSCFTAGITYNKVHKNVSKVLTKSGDCVHLVINSFETVYIDAYICTSLETGTYSIRCCLDEPLVISCSTLMLEVSNSMAIIEYND